MNIIHSWQNYVLSAVVLLALGLIALSLRQFYQLRGRQPSNKNIQWLIVFSAMLILICVITTGYLLSTVFEPTKIIIASVCLFAGLFVWFSACAGNSIAEELTKAATLEHYYATHDDLTALPNLSSFNHQLEKTLSVSRREEDELALLIIGLNRFKVINETLGYFVGDAILKEIAQRIRTSLRKTDLIARLGGDEFAVLINPVSAQGHIHTIANNIAESIQEPLAVEGKPADVGVSIGVAVYPKHASNSIELMETARNALIAAEKKGETVFVYDAEAANEYSEDIHIIGMLQRAIQENQLTILYQPQVRLRDEKIISAEALIRWQHPAYGLLDPGRFIPYAEKAGLIYEINLWLLNNVSQLLIEWHAKNIHLPIAINITANGFLNKDFQQAINTLIKNHTWLTKMLKIELTETSSIDHVDEINESMLKYKKLGLTFSLDDYGTKHASLEYLKKLPFDELKIDQSFMVNAATDVDSRAIIQHAKEIALQLKLTTTAEGIESEKVLEIAKEHGINNGQGYYFSAAMNAIDLESEI